LWDYLGGDKDDWGDIEEIKKPASLEPFSDISHEHHPGQGKSPAQELFNSMDAFEASQPSNPAAT